MKILYALLIILIMSTNIYSQTIRMNGYANFDVDGNSFIQSNIGYYTKISNNTTLSLNQRITKINENWYLLGVGATYYVSTETTDFSTSVDWIDNTVLYDVVFRVQPTKWSSTDLMSSRDFSGVILNSQPMTVFSNGLTTDVKIEPLTIVGGFIRQDFSDGNGKDVYIARVIYSLNDMISIGLNNRFNYTTIETKSYFSPHSYTTHRLDVKYNITTQNDRWVISPEVAIGRQFINSNRQGLYGGGVSFRGTKNKFGINSNISYISSINEYSNYGILLINLKTNINTK